MEEVILAACLSRWASLYNGALFELKEEYGTLETLYRLWQTKKKQIPEPLQAKLGVAWTAKNLADMAQLIQQYSMRHYFIDDVDYPELLKHIPDPPYVLYVQGDITVLQQRTLVSCVGTRRISPYGKRAIEHLFSSLGDYSICLISGMALGVDGEVHRTALEAGIKTVAVVAGGLDGYYPPVHTNLAKEILTQGCIISEYPPGVPAFRNQFLERNRIIAGMAQATVIIEGQMRSGSLVTAKAALQYGRDVAAVPGDIFTSNSVVPHQLIRDGAWPLLSSDDVLAFLHLEAQPKTSLKKLNNNPLYNYLRAQGQTSLDKLAENLNLPIPEISKQLTLLELDGLISCTATGQWFACA